MKQVAAVILIVALVLAAAGTAVLVLVGDDGRADSSSDLLDAPTTSPDPGATDPPSADLAAYYSQTLSWDVCREKFLCATLTVPLDYADAAGPTIDVALLKQPAAVPADRIGSLVVNPGGPGVPGTDYAAHASSAFGQPLLDQYDVVGFDPRGTGASTAVDCLSDDELDDFVAGDPDPDTPAEVVGHEQRLAALADGCAEHSGALAAHVSTVEAARDVDVLRAALGESSLDWFGASYGTMLGATYADLFPDKVGRMVLDGAVDPSLTTRELDLQQAAGFETALRAYVGACVDDEDDCFLGDSVDAGIARISSFLDSVDAKPLPTDSERELAIGNAFYGVAFALYSQSFWTYLDQALANAFDGDGTLLLVLSDAYASRGPSGYTDNSTEAFYAINCLDDPWSIPAAEVPAQVPAFEEASPTFGRTFAWSLTDCSGFPQRASEGNRELHATGAPPIVVVGTTRDPATPMVWAEALADQLESGVLIRRDGDGHTGYNDGNECVDSAVEDYLLAGTVPEDGLAC